MGISLSTLTSVRRTCRVEFYDQVINVEYSPTAITPKFNQQVAGDEVSISDFLVKWCSKVLLSWDVTEDDGTMVPLTEESLAGVPTRLLDTLYGKLIEDMKPSKPSSGSFGAG